MGVIFPGGGISKFLASWGGQPHHPLQEGKICPLLITENIPELVTYSYEERLSQISFNDNDILKIIRALNINKAHVFTIFSSENDEIM